MTKSKKKGKVGKPSVWKNEMYVEVFRLAQSGFPDTKISAALGICHSTFQKYKKQDKALRHALLSARKVEDRPAEFRDYVYHRLPEDLRMVWDSIQDCETEPNAINQMEAMLSQHGKTGRQHLFLYALVHYNFSLSQACRAINIRRGTFDRWITTDPAFGELIQEIHEAKKDFFEAALVDLVKSGDANAIMFVNKTLNADRGYNPATKIKHETSGSIEHKHSHALTLDDLNLPLDQKRAILEQMRQRQETKALPAHED